MFEKKEFANLKGIAGFSDKALDTHFALYDGYVNNANKNSELLKKLDKAGSEYAEVKRRLGWEINGVVLHELYFENLGGGGQFNEESYLAKTINENFESYEEWQSDFLATGKMRGIGWVVLYQDAKNGNLANLWINEHDGGHPAGWNPLLVMDVFEHAYFPDYGKDRAAYLEAFMKNVNWREVEKRLK